MNNISESINKPITGNPGITAPSKPKPHYGWLITLASFFLVLFLLWGFTSYNRWSDTHYFHNQFPIFMRLSWPVQVWERKAVVIKQQLPEFTGTIDTPVKKYIADKFGIYDAKIALGIVQAESGFNEQAWHVNKDGSLDSGIWQINSVHYKQAGCSLTETLDPIRATDCAYSIYKASGDKWNSWTTFTNNSYLSFL